MGDNASTIYIDHSIVTHEADWPLLEHAVESQKVRLALSVWNVYEIGRATDRAQLDKRLAFLDSLHPIWMIECRAVQRQEVARFLSIHYFKRLPSKVVATIPYFSQSEAIRTGKPR
jgi:hypothetical protein